MKKPKIVGLCPRLQTIQLFRRCMGSFSEVVDVVLQNPTDNEIRKVGGKSGVILVAISEGGEDAAMMTNGDLAPRIHGVLLYECPTRTITPRPREDTKVCMVWNNYTPWSPIRKRIKAKSISDWEKNTGAYNFTRVTGSLKSHFRTVPYFPYRNFAWDTGLNLKLLDWIDYVSYETAYRNLREDRGSWF